MKKHLTVKNLLVLLIALSAINITLQARRVYNQRVLIESLRISERIDSMTRADKVWDAKWTRQRAEITDGIQNVYAWYAMQHYPYINHSKIR